MQYTHPIYFLAFLPIMLLVYMLCPQKKRWFALLLASYSFFYIISRHLIVYLLFTTISIYVIGLWIEKIQLKRDELIKSCERTERKLIKKHYKQKQLKIVVLGSILQIGLLVVLKYSNFLTVNFNHILHTTIPMMKFLVPIGISFYTLQAVSYLIDI